MPERWSQRSDKIETLSAHWPTEPLGVCELHLHLEGSVSAQTAIELAAERGHSWGDWTPGQLQRRFRYASFSDFLGAIRDMCLVISSIPAIRRVARELSSFLARYGIEYAEVYVSPYIHVRWGLDFDEVLHAAIEGFDEGESSGGAYCAILVDVVRQWGPGPAAFMIERLEAGFDRVVGVGIGGEESVGLEQFAEAFRRARNLGLHTVAHAGEIGPAGDIWTALETLEPDRIAHGIRAVDDPALIEEIVRRRIPLDLAISSNYRTRAVEGLHPIRRFIDQGVIVTVSSDDPSLFRTDPIRELRRARRFGRLTREETICIARNAVDVSFADDATKRRMRATLDARLDRQD